MIVLDGRDGISRSTVLALLLCATPEPFAVEDAPELDDPVARERVMAWARKQPPGALPLADIPLSQASLHVLRERGDRLGTLLAELDRNRMWVVGRDDAAFPKRLRRRLGASAPLLLFGQGDAALLGRGGVAVVHGAAAERTATSMLDTALAESMLGLITLASGADHIRIERVAAPGAVATLMLSPPGIVPGIAFEDRVALERCCYGLADTVVAVGLGRGDPAWSGLVTLIAQDRQPVWVHGSSGDSTLLVRAGARAIPPGLLADGADGLLLPEPRGRRQPRTRVTQHAAPGMRAQVTPSPTLVRGFAEAQAAFGADLPLPTPPRSRAPMLRLVSDTGRPPIDNDGDPGASPPGRPDPEPTLFELFARRLEILLTHGPLGAGRIAEAMDLTRPQVDAWLLRAEATGAVRSDQQTRMFALP